MKRAKSGARDIVVSVSAIGHAGEVHEPFPPRYLTEKSGMLPFHPEMPGRGDEKKNENSIPAQQFTETNAGLSEKAGEQAEHRRGIKQAVQAFRHAGEGRANPEADEPGTPARATFVAANRAIDRARDEGAEDRFRHNDAPEQKRSATAQVNEAGEEPVPRSAEPIPDQESERDGGDHGERNREAHGPSR